MKKKIEQEVTILIAGNSGDGIQLIGNQFTRTSAATGNDISTLPDFPAEIRAPQGTISGISGFQIHFGSIEISSPGDLCDVLVVMNAAALKKHLSFLKKGGTVIANTDGFSLKNLQLASYPENADPLNQLSGYSVHKIDVSTQSRKLLEGTKLGKKDQDLSKNMFALGFIYWLYSFPLQYTESFLLTKFRENTELLSANLKLLKAGYNFGETSETFTERFVVKSAKMPSGTYRNITGNQALALGLTSGAFQADLKLFYSGYPITPASDLLHYFSSYKNIGVKSFQAEDEIAAITSAIGASYAGNLGVTGTSGPGMALKQEGLGLAFMLELPLVIVNVQRGGPSTGLPTKTEQSDLFQALYGRNGEAPLPVLAPRSPSHAFEMGYHAVKIAVEYMTPVVLLSDGYLANGSEPWRFPKSDQLDKIYPTYPKENDGKSFLPYQRDEKGARLWVFPGKAGYEHTIGSLEKKDQSGKISYEAENHEKMVHLRQKKIDHIQKILPLQQLDSGNKSGELLILSWGSTYGTVRAAMKILLAEGFDVAHAHLEYLYPFARGLKTLLKGFKKVLVPELNNGQLVHVLRDRFLINAISLTKIQGIPFSTAEICDKVRVLMI